MCCSLGGSISHGVADRLGGLLNRLLKRYVKYKDDLRRDETDKDNNGSYLAAYRVQSDRKKSAEKSAGKRLRTCNGRNERRIRT